MEIQNQGVRILKETTPKSLTPKDIARLQIAVNRFIAVGAATAELFAANK